MIQNNNAKLYPEKITDLQEQRINVKFTQAEKCF